jgi:hypothetical protein
MATFADRGGHVVSVTDPYGRILEFRNKHKSGGICILNVSQSGKANCFSRYSYRYENYTDIGVEKVTCERSKEIYTVAWHYVKSGSIYEPPTLRNSESHKLFQEG